MPNKPKVYNLSWFSLAAGTKENPAPVARHNTSTISSQKKIGVVILYPALATPEILVGDTDKLEVLLLTQTSYSVSKLRNKITNQLKISDGLDATKSSADRGLFVDTTGTAVGSVTDRTIDIKPLTFAAGQLITTDSGRFSAYVDKRAFQMYSDAGYTKLYSVSMSSKCLAAAMGGTSLSSCGEPQDVILNTVLDKRNSWAKTNGKYSCFATGATDVDFTQIDAANPIQSYHPVYFYGTDDLKYANLAHISDVHMAARQQVLAKTRARVIDYKVKGAEADFGNSPAIGDLINVSSRDMVQILGKLGSSDADMLVIGGDLVDFLRSCFLSADVNDLAGAGKPSDVWQAVGLGDNYTDNYKDCPDMIGFFGILLNFCRTTGKPAYAITGNHDCYWLPYGISPRIDLKVAERRANEGIPADHNLTFYEAILAFGETYGELKSGLSSPFTADMFDWFYAMFTPFSDYSAELPNQYLVAYGWGETEDLFDTPGTGQGFGHLPRSDDGISDEQLVLLTNAVAKKKKVILTTHFTFVSYSDTIPIDQGDTELGDVYFSTFKNYEDHDNGTFEENRAALYETHCGLNRDIQIILTGHSHRRALYFVDRVDYSGRNSVKIRHFDFTSFAHVQQNHASILEPAIVVSDSGGSIPRYNLSGEFKGRGSDSPSGTTVMFDQDTGKLSAIAAARADICRPRVAVALDYLDIQEGQDVIVKFQTPEFSIEDEKTNKLTGLTFEIELDPDLAKRGFTVQSLAFFMKWSAKHKWYKIDLSNSGANKFSITDARDVQKFTAFIANNRTRGNFLAMKFSANGMPRYNFDDAWCWEFQVDFDTSGRGLFQWSPTRKLYKILRDKKRAEIPDFDWRRANAPGKYN